MSFDGDGAHQESYGEEAVEEEEKGVQEDDRAQAGVDAAKGWGCFRGQ